MTDPLRDNSQNNARCTCRDECPANEHDYDPIPDDFDDGRLVERARIIGIIEKARLGEIPGAFVNTATMRSLLAAIQEDGNE